MGNGQIRITMLTWIWIILEEPKKGVKIKLIPIFLSSSFRTVVTTLEYKNGAWSNWNYNGSMHMECPGETQKDAKIYLGYPNTFPGYLASRTWLICGVWWIPQRRPLREVGTFRAELQMETKCNQKSQTPWIKVDFFAMQLFLSVLLWFFT